MSQRIFDGHNDVLLRLSRRDRTGTSFLGEGSEGHVDLGRARRGGLVGGIFATFVPDGPAGPKPDNQTAADGSVDVPQIAAQRQERALNETLAQLAIALRIERRSEGAVRICRSAEDIDDTVAAGSFAMMLHLEGAEAIGPDLDELEVLYAAGVRSVGLVWSRPTIFGYGVPFRFPSGPDIGEGLTERGIALVKSLNSLGMMIDCSRHYLPVPLIKRMVDALSAAKGNVLHWHFMDVRD